MKLEEPKNKNYCAIVTRLDKFVILPNCSNVKAAIIFGNSIIVGMDTPDGAVGLYFPAETALSKEFCGANNLFRKPEWGNTNPEVKGFFEEHGRVKTMKFRGHKSEGFWLPISSLAYIGIPLVDFEIGMEFDKIGDFIICQKYVPKRNKVSNPSKKQGRQPRLEDKIVDGQFHFHIDTANLRRNIHQLYPDQLISISDKWHGTSAIYSNILTNRKLPWYEKALKFLGVKVKELEYGFTWASRRVVKGVAGETKQNSNHFYDDDIWSLVAKEVEPVVFKGFTIYGEIVGYTGTGGEIQSGYTYGCQQGSHRFLVYRITQVNPDGRVLELSWLQMKLFCQKFGLEMVKEYYYGFAKDFGSAKLKNLANISVPIWQEKFLEELEELYVSDFMCSHNNNQVPAEGVVLKIDALEEAWSYKCKNFAFLKRESDLLDSGELDMETQESEETVDNETSEETASA